ncbi:MAG: SoxR reducing system RseC family protein [Azoarcus sp.]|jgi:sigma-E factor negative regulatory protein RseC|nr:SoxR reducing system RseC family protein [Azoarcus sp.]
MIEAMAVVMRAGEGKIWARVLERQGSCGHCDESGGCHAPRFTEMFKGHGQMFALDDPFGLDVGARIKLVVDEGVPLRAALASYGLGTVLILAGAVLGVWLAPLGWADAAAGAGVMIGVAIAVGILYGSARRRGAPAWRLRIERDGGGAAACPGQRA